MADLKQIGDIQIFAKIHDGATTDVYKGYQAPLERFVLLKVLKPELSFDADVSKQFEDEARYVARIQHPNVVTIFDSGNFEGLRYFAAEFVDGLNLADVLQQGPLPPDLAAYVLIEACKGLRAAHDKGILHKDLKPANILISHEGQIKIADFGMAGLNKGEPGEIEKIQGTVAYFSPEQILGQHVGKHSDIFSLGATFYEMLTGFPAFAGESMQEKFKAILNDDPTEFLQRKHDIPAELTAICAKMLAKKASERYADCAELLDDLKRFQQTRNFAADAQALALFLQKPEQYKAARKQESGSASPQPKVTHPRNRRKYLSFALVAAVGVLTLFLLQKQPFSESPPQLPEAHFKTDQVNEDSVNGATLLAGGEEADNPAGVVEKHQAEEEPLAAEKMASHRARTEKRTSGDVAQPDTAVSPAGTEAGKPVARNGTLRLTCTPWAYVFVDGDSVGLMTTGEMQLPVGEHDLLFKNPEFPFHKTRVKIAAAETHDVQFSFWTTVGTLTLVVSPWAEIYVDEKYVDTIPPQNRPIVLTPGTHRLLLKHPQLGEWQSTVNVLAGEKKNLKFNLTTLLAK